MLKFLKELFLGKPAEPAEPVVSAPYKVPEPVATTPISSVVEEVQPVTEVKTDPVAVALDLEPLDLSATAEPAKKPRKPRAPKAAEAKPAKKVATKAAAKKPAARTATKKAK